MYWGYMMWLLECCYGCNKEWSLARGNWTVHGEARRRSSSAKHQVNFSSPFAFVSTSMFTLSLTLFQWRHKRLQFSGSGSIFYACIIHYRPQRSCVKVMFSHASVILFTGGRGMHVRGAYMVQGCSWQGVCMAGGMCGGGGACTAQQTATAADGTHPTGMHSCHSHIVTR